MGADQFITRAQGSTAAEAFKGAVEQARYEHGHSGYTGTIAEKRSYKVINAAAEAPSLVAKLRKTEAPPWWDAKFIERVEAGEPGAVADALLALDDPRVSDKWGPAGCIRIKAGEWLFFGWASS